MSAEAATEDGANERADEVPLPGSIYERSMFGQETSVVQRGNRWLVVAPITERGDAIGLLEASFSTAPSAETLGHMAGGAHALAYVLIAARRHTDLFEWAQRDVAFTLAAECNVDCFHPPTPWKLGTSPSRAGENPHTVGGDTFDYSLDREFLYVSMTDAMGHGVVAALLATIIVGSLRNTRRSRATPVQQADAANAALLSNARSEQFVTGQILRISLADGRVDFVNAGHPSPYLVRDAQANEVDIGAPQLPFGIKPGLLRGADGGSAARRPPRARH